MASKATSQLLNGSRIEAPHHHPLLYPLTQLQISRPLASNTSASKNGEIKRMKSAAKKTARHIKRTAEKFVSK